jgi:23S rRNA (uracil1939-C5)-methyltransferase
MLSGAARDGYFRGMPPNAQTVTVRIDDLSADGAGVGRLPDGRVVFVHRTAPGDEARIRLTQEKRRWARGTLLGLAQTGPSRRDAPCPHYARCGGCTLEHLTYEAQLEAKARRVAQSLRRIGGIDAELPPITPSPAEHRYRNRVSFTLLRLEGERVIAGFHDIEDPNRIVEITDACLLPEPAVAEAWGALRAAWGPSARLLPAGRRLRLTLRGTAGGATTLLIEGGHGRGRAELLVERVPSLAAVWHRPDAGREPQLLAGASRVEDTWAGEPIGLGGALFLQVNRGAAALLEAHVLERAGDVHGLRVVDAYSGVGVYARRLARAGARVTAIEQDAHAVTEGRRAAPEAGFVEGTVESRLEGALPADLVIVNPPRGGLGPEVRAALLARPPARLLYISCDPATLARDAESLAAALRLRGVRCFDLFPQTAHVETVAEFECATS